MTKKKRGRKSKPQQEVQPSFTIDIGNTVELPEPLSKQELLKAIRESMLRTKELEKEFLRRFKRESGVRV